MSGPRDAAALSLLEPWPLTGRSTELSDVVASLQAGCRAYFLLGAAGCGKTRLAREVVQRLAAEGWATGVATATESARQTPLGALAHLIPVGTDDSPAASVDAVRASLQADHAERPTVLHIDDAHSLDPSSALLLVGLVESGAVRLIVTARVGTTLPDSLVSLRAGDGVRSAVVDVLDRAATRELLHRVLGGPLDGIAESQLMRLAHGNPLFLRELVIGGVADGSLHPIEGVWQLRGQLPATEALGDRVLGRLATLSPGEREALELVAVGEPVGIDLVGSLGSEQALEALEQRGLIRVAPSGRRHEIWLAHPVYGEVLRSSMGKVGLRRRSRRLAEAVHALGARRATDSGQLVRWQLDGGMAPQSDRVLHSAQVARHHNDWVTSARLARVAYDAGLADAANLLAESHYALGEFEEGDLVAEPAMAEPGRLSDAALTSLHRTRAGVWFFGSREPADALGSIVEAAQQVSDPDLRDMLGYAQAAMFMWSGRVREAKAVAEPLLEAPDPKVRVQAAIAVETVASTAGPASVAIELADHWYGVHAGLPDLNGTNSPAFHLLIKTEALVSAGRFDEAEGLGNLGYEISVASFNRIAQMWFTRQLGRIAMYRGDAAASRRWLVELGALCRGTSWLRPLALGLSDLAIAEAHLGDAVAARAAIAQRDALGVPVIELFSSEGARGTAWALAAAGDVRSARSVLVAGAEAAEEAGIFLLGALARVDALRLGAPDQAGPLADAAAVVGSEIVTLAARWAAADGDAEELEAVGAAFEELGCLLHAAEVFLAAGRAWQRGGKERQATAASLRAEGLQLRCEGAAAPVGSHSAGRPAPPVALTPREREIAVLVAEGLSTKEVAEQLYLSSRTVSNHLQNAYTKLGITSRSELPEALARLTLQPDPT